MPIADDRELMQAVIDRAMILLRKEMPGTFAYALVIWDRETGRVSGGAGGPDGGVSVGEMLAAMNIVAEGALRHGPTRRYQVPGDGGKGGRHGN
jgi:hypothetical protein